jgi:hypothetical protein
MEERRTEMKKQIFLFVLGVMLLLIPGALWAVNQPAISQDIPAILVSLGQANAIPLDDGAAAAVRGQAGTDYVLVKVIGLNMFDYGSGVKWTLNPLGYRYGYWGGPGWSGSDVTLYADGKYGMDYFFMRHDRGQITDRELRDNLAALPYTKGTYSADWGGMIYDVSPAADPTPPPSSVNVYGFSLIGGKIFTRPVAMPYSEYSRREAVYGMQLLILGKSILRIN